MEKEDLEESALQTAAQKRVSEFLSEIDMDEDEMLAKVRSERQDGEDFSYDFKLEIEADLKLLKNRRDKKKDEKLVGDSTLFNTHSALLSRSYQAKSQIRLKGDKNGVEREIKMLNAALTEDVESAYLKALKYYLYDDKFAVGVSIFAKVGWDGVYKRNVFQVINPLTWIPDPSGDYFTGDYGFTGFIGTMTCHQLEKYVPEPEHTIQNRISQGSQDLRERMQRMLGLNPRFSKEIFDTYYHFTHVDGRKVWVLTVGCDAQIIDAGICKPNSALEEKNDESITFPFSFYYWKPDRNNPFGDRPANYVRDVQLQKAEIANLRLNKMRAELYPMYLYNKDYVKGTDLDFGFNKRIPISTGIDGAQVSLGNIVQPIQKDLRIDTSFAVEASLDRMVEKSTSIGEVVQGTTPTQKETLGTNKLVQTNTDVNLSLNEELHSIGDEQFVKMWFGGYYQNFTSGDKKLIFAGSSTGKEPIVLRRKDFVYEGNLGISIETNVQGEDRKRKENAAITQVYPIVSPSLGSASKIKFQRLMMERAGIPAENIEEILLDSPQMALQCTENELLKLWIFVPINPEDDDESHLVAMGSNLTGTEAEAHKLSHIKAMIAKGTVPQGQASQQWAGGVQEGAMANSMASQAMSQAGAALQR